MSEYVATMTMEFDSNQQGNPFLLSVVSELDEKLMALCPERSFSRTNAEHSRYELVFLTASRSVMESRIRVLERSAEVLLSRRGIVPSIAWSRNSRTLVPA